MKHFSKLAIMTICLIITALFTSACGGGGKSTPPNNSALYYLLAQQNNQQGNNNNQQENNNEEEPNATTDITLTLADSLNADNIATADIFYSVDNTAKATDEEDKEILKAEPTAEAKTKFAVSLPAGIDISNVKIKAILTYDSEGNLLDYFSSYDGVSAENGIFNINFENENGDFGGGTGTATDPYIISTPRHFVNINKKDDEGNYLYLDKHFKQTADIDFTHLTGLKIVKADDDKDITIETTNEKAPFYNNGEGNESIGKYEMESGNGDGEGKDPEMASLHVIPAGRIDPIEPTVPTEDPTKNCFKGSYDGDNHTIDGLMFVNPKTNRIVIFDMVVTNKEPIKNLTIGKNSIFFIDKNNEIYNQSLAISPISVFYSDGTENISIENIENNAKIVVKNVEASSCLISGITPSAYNYTITTCINNGNITLYNNKFAMLYVNGIVNMTDINFSDDVQINNTIFNCTNTGHITIAKTDFFDNPNTPFFSMLKMYVSGIVGEIQSNSSNQTNTITNCTNTGVITVSENKDMGLYCGGLIADLYASNISDLTNTGDITVTNNTFSNNDHWIFVYGIATMLSTDGTTIDGATIINEGTITVTGNTEGCDINKGELIGPGSIIGPVFPPTPLIP